MRSAISPSRASRPVSFSISRIAAATARALRCTERGAQSSLRSASIIAPRMRMPAYVSKLAPRFGRVVRRRFEQAQHSGLDQVRHVHRRRQAAGQMVGNALHQLRVARHERVASRPRGRTRAAL